MTLEPRLRTITTMRLALVVALLAAVAACGGSSTSPTEASTSSAPSFASTAPPAGRPTPNVLRGKWVDRDNDQLFLTLRARTYRVDAGGGYGSGQVSVRGATLFAFSGNCGDVIGHYRWSVDNGRLRFAKVSDTCMNRAGVFADRVFIRAR